MQRGSILATTSVVLAGILAVAGLSVLSVQRSIGVSGQQRGKAQARYAAEAGVAAAASFLRTRLNPGMNWGAYSAPPDAGGGAVGVTPADLPGNGALPGTVGNAFDPAANTWYEVTLYNNVQDPGYATGQDTDARILIRSTGHGPDSERVVLEVEVHGTTVNAPVTRGTWREIL